MPGRITCAAIVFLVVTSASLRGQELPRAERGSHVDVYHGVRVADPYRWMEDMDSEATQRWIRAQDRYARAFTTSLSIRDLIRERMSAIGDTRRISSPIVRGELSFYTEQGGGLLLPRLVLRRGESEPRIVIDPVALDPTGNTRLSRWRPSPDGRYLAYALSVNSSRWETWRVREIATGRDMGGAIVGMNSIGSSNPDWTLDSRGFFYEWFAPPEEGESLMKPLVDQRLMYHRVGTDQAADAVIANLESPDTVAIGTGMTVDGRYAVVWVGARGSRTHRVSLYDLREGGELRPLITEDRASYSYVGSHGSTLWFATNDGAPNWKIVAMDAEHPDRTRDLVPEGDPMDRTAGATAVGDKIIVAYRRDARLYVQAYERSGAHAFEVDLRGGETWGFVGEEGDSDVYFRTFTVVDPGTVYRVDLEAGRTVAWAGADLPYDPNDFVTRQVFFESFDGTRIPMFVVHRRDIELNGEHPLFLYGYGAMNWSAAPWFQPKISVWLQMGGIYAIPNIRGGGEYGTRWADAGRRRNKQTSINDFFSAAEWLIENGYTSRNLLVANGGSASGPLVGAAITQRPDLFAASVVDFPALDMLRLDAYSGGRGWRPEFGSMEDEEDFKALHAYSPYHNVRSDVCYPATIVSPGELDESTVPMHAYKFVAALQNAQACDNPILLRVSWGAGHNAGATPADRLDTWTDQLAFLTEVLRWDLEGTLTTERPGRTF